MFDGLGKMEENEIEATILEEHLHAPFAVPIPNILKYFGELSIGIFLIDGVHLGRVKESLTFQS